MTKRLLYIGNALSRKGSTVTSVEILSELLRNEDYQVRIASSQPNKILRMLDMMWHTIRYARQTDFVLIDTYSTSNFWYAVIVGYVCRLLKLPYIPILRGGDLPNRIKKSHKTSKRLFTNAKINIAPSQYIIDAFKSVGIDNITYIPNTIETAQYTFKKRSVVAPRLLWVRSFSKIYNPLMALKVLKNLTNTYPKASLTMVGPEKDESYKECLAFAKANDLPVIFTGMLSKEAWRSIANDHDIFINTTNFDNAPVSVIEAMALGLPVISTNVGGLPFLITHEKDGLLTPANEIELFCNSVVRLLKEPQLCATLSENGRKKAESFDWAVLKVIWGEVLS